MKINFKELRVPANYPIYPPYHEGDYLEEYFYNFYIQNKKEFDDTGFTLIPVFWTNVYITGKNRELLQTYINYLPKNKKYFTVSQHDDAIQEQLPKDTISFTAGGRAGGVPIPLVCSSIPKKYINNSKKDILCSFVGSISTTSGLRQNMYTVLQNKPGFYFSEPRWWTPTVPTEKIKEFFEITQRSWFTLCPRGYGLQSFRMFEALQLGSIPIFIYDDEWFPFKEFIDWSTFSICVHKDEIKNIPNLINNLALEQREKLISNGKAAYENLFCLKQTCMHVLKHLKMLRSKF